MFGGSTIHFRCLSRTLFISGSLSEARWMDRWTSWFFDRLGRKWRSKQYIWGISWKLHKAKARLLSRWPKWFYKVYRTSKFLFFEARATSIKGFFHICPTQLYRWMIFLLTRICAGENMSFNSFCLTNSFHALHKTMANIITSSSMVAQIDMV